MTYNIFRSVTRGSAIRPRRPRYAAAVALIIALAGCDAERTTPLTEPEPPSAARHAASSGDNAVVQWNRTALEAVRRGRLGPPMVARALAIVHTAVYDAWAAYDEVAVGTRRGGSLRRPAAEHTPSNKTEALSYAAYRALADLFPDQRELFDARMARLGYDPDDRTTDPATPAGIGNIAAAALLEFRHGDGSNQENGYIDPTGYQPANSWDELRDPNRWQPLRVPTGSGDYIVQTCLAPHWGAVIPFALESGAHLRPGPPALFPHGRYRAQAEELIRLSARLDDRQKVIAEYWADGPNSEQPPGHWNLFAQFVSERDGHTLDEDVKLFFALTNAVFDAGIAAWDAKAAYDYVRPISAIPFLKQGKKIRAWAGPHQGTRVIDGQDWIPYQPVTFPTPPFAEYVSGHSTFSAAGAEILASFTGSDRFGHSASIAAGSSPVEPGAVPARDLVLHWQTFSDAADEAGMSRRYGGIHFEDADLEARKMGRAVGQQAWAKALSYFDGTATRFP